MKPYCLHSGANKARKHNEDVDRRKPERVRWYASNTQKGDSNTVEAEQFTPIYGINP